MRTILFTTLLVGWAAAQDKTDGKDKPIRELNLKGVRLDDVKAEKGIPVKVTNAEELAKALPDKEAAEAIRKQVDFDKEYIAIFAWEGSGRDEIRFRVEKGEKESVAVFALSPGRTKDLRQHRHVFAVRKDLALNPPPAKSK